MEGKKSVCITAKYLRPFILLPFSFVRFITTVRSEASTQRPTLPTLLMLPRKTTSTAQYLQKKASAGVQSEAPPDNAAVGFAVWRQRSSTYPAEAATISCLLAFVNAERAAENTRVKTRTTQMVSGLVAMVPSTENL